MCEYCKQYECPPSCPSFDGYVSWLGSPTFICEMCEGKIYEGDVHYVRGDRALCEDCAKELVSPELLEFLGCDDIKDFFDLLW